MEAILRRLKISAITDTKFQSSLYTEAKSKLDILLQADEDGKTVFINPYGDIMLIVDNQGTASCYHTFYSQLSFYHPYNHDNVVPTRREFNMIVLEIVKFILEEYFQRPLNIFLVSNL